MKYKYALFSLLGLSVAFSAPVQAEDSNKVTIIHTGDFHGHLIPRANVRSDSSGRKEGGLARVATVIKKIREDQKNALRHHSRWRRSVVYTRPGHC